MKAGNVPRPGGTIGHCNHLARYVGLLLPVSITLALTHSSRGMRLFTGLVSVAGLLSLLYTLTRSAWIGLFVSITVIGYYLFVRGHLNLRLISKIGFAALLFLLLVIFYRSLIIGRVMDYDFGSAKTRLTTARVALKIIRDHPFLGVGINNYGTVLDTYWDAEDTFTRRTAVHNAYLLIAAEIGLLGFGSFIWILAAAYTRIRRAIRLRVRELSILAIGIMGAFSGFLVTALSDKSHKESYILLFVFWALLAIVEAVIRYGESAAREARV
jgi:O-antigen ligase